MHLSNSQASIIIVADTLFYPPRRNGFSVRYFPLVVELTRMGFQVDIIVTNKYREHYSISEIDKLRSICGRIDIINAQEAQPNPARRLVRKIANISHIFMPFGIPYHLLDNNTGYIQHCIHDLLIQREVYDFGIGVGVGGCNADLLLSLAQEIRPRKIICDFVDSAYLLRTRTQHKFSPVLNPLACLENEKTRRWEKSFCERCICVYISGEDAKTVGGENVYVIPNCVVEDGFDTSKTIDLESPNIAFLGNMSYPPNVAACTYLISRLLPNIKKRIPDIHLYIVGRQPSKELLQHGTAPNIHITGEVENIWDYIRSANAFVFPMQTGAGLQNKVLEAMYAGKPVITSAIGNEGINAKHGREIYIANNIDEYVNSVEETISHSDRIGNNAKAFVKIHFSSQSLAREFEILLRNRPPMNE